MAVKSTKQRQRSSKKMTNTQNAKKPLPDPTHLGHFISILVMSLCKKTIHIDTSVKIALYVCGVLIGSIFADVFALPKSYFSDKNNILNRVFVSFGFGWTLILLSTYIILTSFVYTCGNWKLVIQKHILRMAIAALWWFSLTKSFGYVDSVIGVCSISTHKQKYECLKAGKTWLGFDISGHVFLLIHNLLTISEEVKSFKTWSSFDSLLNEDDLASKRNLTEQEILQARISYKRLTPYIKINILFLTLWTVFCESMLIISVVYRFHTPVQKVTGAFLAVACWFVTYKIILESKVNLLPSQPGQCSLNYMKSK